MEYEEIEEYINGLLLLMESVQGEATPEIQSSMAKQLAYIVTLVRHKYGLVSGIYAPAELAALRLYDEKYDKELFK